MKPSWVFEGRYKATEAPFSSRANRKIARGIRADLAQLNQDMRRFDWRPDVSHPRESLLSRGNETVGHFEWASERRARGLAEILGVEVACRRGSPNWTKVTVSSLSGERELISRRRIRSRRLEWEGAVRHSWFFDTYTRWYWVVDDAESVVMSFRPKPDGIREIDGVEMWVHRDYTSRPIFPFLAAAGWCVVAAPFWGFPLVPRVLRRRLGGAS